VHSRKSGISTALFSMEDRMKYGARNNIVGKVEEIKRGSVMSQVKVTVDGPIDITSVMTLDTLADLGVKKGDSVRVLVKAVNVILVRE
ncbi:MAG TPA: TOBE domain-containing protein, partial [Burkholderiales bacterium]|nr:TOBE domain-containing protein [Burkholderiales bacterium]